MKALKWIAIVLCAPFIAIGATYAVGSLGLLAYDRDHCLTFRSRCHNGAAQREHARGCGPRQEPHQFRNPGGEVNARTLNVAVRYNRIGMTCQF